MKSLSIFFHSVIHGLGGKLYMWLCMLTLGI